MNVNLLGAPVRRHMNASQLPQRLLLKTQRQLKLIAYRLILMFLVPFSALAAWFEQSLFYVVVSGLLLLVLIALFMLNFQLVLDKGSNQALLCTRFARRLLSQTSIQPLSELSILVHQVPGLAGQYQITLANERYTIGKLADAEQGAAYLAQFCGCQYQLKADEFSALQTVSADVMPVAGKEKDDQIPQWQELYFWHAGAVLKLFAIPFMFFVIIGVFLTGS